MSEIIYKYPFHVGYSQNIAMPFGYRVLAVQMQGDLPCLWAMVNPEKPSHDVEIRVFGTGHPLPDGIGDACYLGTFQHGVFVWHVFEWNAQ